MPSLNLVRIEWLDSRQQTTGWQFLEDVESSGPVVCVSVGFIVSETEDVVMIAQSLGDTTGEVQVSGVAHIPKCCINKTEVL